MVTIIIYGLEICIRDLLLLGSVEPITIYIYEIDDSFLISHMMIPSLMSLIIANMNFSFKELS